MAMKKFEGKPVTRARIKVTRAGDGLSKAMKIDPVELHSGDRGYLVIEYVVGPITFDPIDDGSAYERVQTLRAGLATLIDDELVADAMEKQRIRIEEAEGVLRFPDPDAADEPPAGARPDDWEEGDSDG